MPQARVLFITGQLAEPGLRRILSATAGSDIDPVLTVLPITVIALATTDWIARHLKSPSDVRRVIIPGLCGGDLEPIAQKTGVPVERGPKDMRDLPEYLGSIGRPQRLLDHYDIEILAEINSVQGLTLESIVQEAQGYRDSGADIIDLGCDPGLPWPKAAETVHTLRRLGFRLSIDTFDPAVAKAAVAAGAELVLSINGTNVEHAQDFGSEVVVVPDQPADLESLHQTMERLSRWNVPFRIDPVIEPLGCGFAASLGRYLEVRRRYPEAAMLMGVGNLTELTEVDSAGINALLVGFCQELSIHSVLTTQVINWCRSSVRELDLARRLMFAAASDHIPPKHITSDLLFLRDPKVQEHGEARLRELAEQIFDRNIRLFAEAGQIHAINADFHLTAADPFALLSRLLEQAKIDPTHAFYLGYEMAKATIALKLGKNYTQDQELRWGLIDSGAGSGAYNAADQASPRPSQAKPPS
jgi:dihydropteroate synthase-like protein